MAEAAIGTREADLINAQAQLIGFDDLGIGATLPNGKANDIPLYAPGSGRILQVMQQSATILPAGAPIMEIGDVDGDLEIVVELIASDAVQVKPGGPVRIEDWGGENPLQGVVSRIDPVVIIALSSPAPEREGLGHDYRVEVRIIVWSASDVLRVPSSALFRSVDTCSVFAATQGRASLCPAEI
ncbi:HlyD family secretion protein [Pseudophaeobacter sp.]|uniref:HlyD family secretion protein n=1 Tax=Pseudophaeobacter sp. TaxID=1971739 RepID=UPI00329A6ADF